MRRLVTPPLVIVLAAATLGLTVNSVRHRDAIEIGRVYFADPAAPPVAPGPGQGAAGKAAVAATALDLAARAAAEFAVIDAETTLRLLGAADLEPTGAVFLDARNDADFRTCHLPGALQVDYFNVRRDLEPHLPFLRQAVIRPSAPEPPATMPQPHFPFDDWIGKPRPVLPLIVVYCGSDECEDGFNLCRALRDDFGIESGRILLYLGGMRDWRARRLPVVRGGRLW